MEPWRSLPVGRWILAAVLVIAAAGFFYYGLDRYLSFEALKTHRDALLALTEANYGTAVAAFIISYALITGVSLPGAAIMTLAGGFLFGSVLGTLYVNIAATSGATLAFLAARYLLREWVETKFSERIEAFQRGFAENAFNYLMTLRLIPIFPFFLVNLLCGLTRIRLSTYMLATAIGIVPASFVYAYAGRQLGGLNSMADIATPGVLLAFTLLGLLALVPVLYRRLRSQSTERE
ncbi:MAG: TVP38/TMEM64 family protein [Gammaproteobacteria bacterium]